MTERSSTGRIAPKVLVCLVVLLALAAGAAHAQITTVTANTTTTLWAGSQDTTTFGFSEFTAPFPGVILSGTAISTITGKPVRHLWYGDPLNGFCRIDPEVDAVIPPVNGIGGHHVSITSCLASFTKGISPSQIAYDASTNMLYTADISRTNAGIVRFPYIPSGDNGQGAVDIVHVVSLIGTQLGRNAFGGCGQMFDPKTGSPVPIVPNSAALGPDGNLYAGSIRDGALVRVVGPSTFDPNVNCPLSTTLSGSNPNKLNLPGDRLQIPILSADEQFGSGHTFGLGFVGSTLFGADNIAPWMMVNATQCLTLINGNKMCASPALSNQAPMPIDLLATQVAGPQAGLISDAQLGAFPGSVIYAATFPNLARITNIVSPTSMTVNLNYGGTFSFITGMAADPQDPNNATVYVGADPTQGGINGSGQIWQITPIACAGLPGVPGNVTGVAGLGQATVSWVSTPGCGIPTSYVVRTFLAGGTASGLPDVTVLAPTTTATILGLTNGSSYQFEVQTCTLAGCGAFSALSNVVSLTPPSAPTGVAAKVVSFTSAGVSWALLQDPSVTNYTVSAFDSAAPTVVAASVSISPTLIGCARIGCGFPVVTGLLSGHTYTFTVHATNLFGNGPESAPSLPITLPPAADVAITMTSPLSATVASYTMTITNNGPLGAAQVNLTDTLPAPLSTFATSQGICVGAVGLTSFNCNLGPLAAGATATVTVSVSVPVCGGTFINTATVNALDATGANMDPNLANNTASSVAVVSVLTPACAASTTDIQVTGAAQNGNPVHGTADVFTWQIKNNLGAVAANGVTFTATTTAPFGAGAVLAVIATNPGGTATPGCTFTTTTVNCSLGTIAGGSTAIVTVTAVPSAAAPANSYSMTGNAQLGPGSTDTNLANNSFTVKIGAQ